MRYIEKEKLLAALKDITLEGWMDENLNIPALRVEAPMQAEDSAIAQVVEFLKKEARTKEVFDTQDMEYKTIYIFTVSAERLFGFVKEFLSPTPFRQELLLKLTRLAIKKLEIL